MKNPLRIVLAKSISSSFERVPIGGSRSTNGRTEAYKTPNNVNFEFNSQTGLGEEIVRISLTKNMLTNGRVDHVSYSQKLGGEENPRPACKGALDSLTLGQLSRVAVVSWLYSAQLRN